MLSFGFFEILLSFILVLTPIVFIHELGHFWVARKTGVIVDVFSVGFGKEIFGWTDTHGTRWRFAWIPLGGYVKMRGDENIASGGSSNARILEGSFSNAPLLSRIAIVSAGPIANFVLAFILFVALYIGAGKLFIPPMATIGIFFDILSFFKILIFALCFTFFVFVEKNAPKAI